MKTLYALVFVCMSIPAFAASTETLEGSMVIDHPIYLDDFDYLDVTGETTAQATTRVPGIVIAPAIEPETLVVEEDGTENYNKADSVPGMTTILPDDEDLTGSFADLWGGY
jgi:hypothetical protein